MLPQLFSVSKKQVIKRIQKMKKNLLAFKVWNSNDCNDEAPTIGFVEANDEFFAKLQELVDVFKKVDNKTLYKMDFFWHPLEWVNVDSKSKVPDIATHNVFCIDDSYEELIDLVNEDGPFGVELRTIDSVRTSAEVCCVSKLGIKFKSCDKYSGEDYGTEFITIEQIKAAMNEKNLLKVEE